jgi:hypothetical protein
VGKWPEFIRVIRKGENMRYDLSGWTLDRFMDEAMKWTREFYYGRTHRTFTFRDLMHNVGVPLCNENNWAVGQWLQAYAAKRGIEPLRLLTRKTNPNPTVDAPHCIAHYPMSLFDDAASELATTWNDKTRQLTMEFA